MYRYRQTSQSQIKAEQQRTHKITSERKQNSNSRSGRPRQGQGADRAVGLVELDAEAPEPDAEPEPVLIVDMDKRTHEDAFEPLALPLPDAPEASAPALPVADPAPRGRRPAGRTVTARHSAPAPAQSQVALEVDSAPIEKLGLVANTTRTGGRRGDGERGIIGRGVDVVRDREGGIERGVRGGRIDGKRARGYGQDKGDAMGGDKYQRGLAAVEEGNELDPPGFSERSSGGRRGGGAPSIRVIRVNSTGSTVTAEPELGRTAHGPEVAQDVAHVGERDGEALCVREVEDVVERGVKLGVSAAGVESARDVVSA
ncbi:hypothetical protein C8R44DRAFT_731196 [Mycena epipterygia]|nr:hypothetical protein C8R44DRAFT_731196 [Mycena epipterygia]